MSGTGHYLALCGGVGGAKLVDGLAAVLPPEALTVAVNVGDDFEHYGLRICPDLDTVSYTLAGIANPAQGWGRADESWQVMAQLEDLGGETWFRLGDRDLALHLRRRSLLDSGLSLSETTREILRRLGVAARVSPVSDEPVRTWVETEDGPLAFQDYFVRRRCEPAVRGLEYRGATQAKLAHAVESALAAPDLAGVIVCPSNPFLSIAPMLAIPDLRARLRALPVPVLAVSPIVGGRAVKGPAAKMLGELGMPRRADAILDLYGDFVDLVLIDEQDRALAARDARLAVAPTIMDTRQKRIALAECCVQRLRDAAPDRARASD